MYYSRIGTIHLITCMYACYNNFFLTYLQLSVGLFGGLFNISPMSMVFDVLIIIISLLVLNLTGFYSRKYLNFANIKLWSNVVNERGERYTIIEYTLIILFIITGSMLLISSNDLISLYISIELQSYGLYILCTIYRNSENSTASGLTYFLLGGLSSCFILLGVGLVYANTGTTYLENFYIITNISNILNEINNIIYLYNYIPYCLILITVGFLFKIAAAPFHF